MEINKISEITELLNKRGKGSSEKELSKKFGIAFNPFPKSGISDLNISDALLGNLPLIDKDIQNGLIEFIVDSLFSTNPDSSDKYISALVRGDYGYGKTQTLLYAKFLIESLSEQKNNYYKKVFVAYIDNPGAKLSELIGSIVAQIGEENFRRYLWDRIIEKIQSIPDYKRELLSHLPRGHDLFRKEKYKPFSSTNIVSYKSFIDSFLIYFTNAKTRNSFFDDLKSISVDILSEEFGNSTVAIYFFDFLSEKIGVNKTWEAITTGGIKNLEKKEVFILQAIVKIIQNQGYTDFFILVDEFEAVTEGRLSSKEIDQYFRNLRTLIDKERNWCSIFAMTGLAYSKLKSTSPPLAERISSRVLDLKPLNLERAKLMTLNYLNLAREENTNEIYPFTDIGIQKLRTLSKGIPRLYLRGCYQMLQRASEELSINDEINSKFIEEHYRVEEE